MKKIIGSLFFSLFCINTIIAQSLQVKGKVIDEDGEGIPGVNVSVEGTTTGTITNLDGNYQITIQNESATLVYSFVGMKTAKEQVSGRSTINVTMQFDVQELADVMVVAYGTSTKEAYTGAAQVVDNEVLENRPVTSFEKALQGTTAGLMVTSSSGQPGAASTVRIRGIGSFSGGAPLYVLDGVPMNGSISDINPNDIENVTVLKDAAASSLYGSRAANGVILITTKKGKAGTTRISINSQVGFSQRISDGYALMNSTDIYEHSWRGLYNQAIIKDGLNVDDASSYAHENVQDIVGFNPFGVDNPLDANGKLIDGTQVITNTNWRDEIYKTGVIQNHNINISGGNDATKVFFSLGQYSDNGTVLSSNFNRFTNKISVSHKINNFLDAGINSLLSYAKTQAPPGGTGGSNPVRAAEVINAASPVYNADGSYNWDNKAIFDFNPVGLAELDEYTYETKRAVINSYLNARIGTKFNFRTTLGIDNSIDQGLTYYNPFNGNGAGVNGRSSKYAADNLAWNISNIFTYTEKGDDGVLEILLGQEAQGTDYNYLYAEVTDFSVPQQPDLVWGANPEQPSSFNSSSTLVSYLGQAKYDYLGRYYLSASLRSDGSSRFGENHKYGLFYSVGAGWNITDEEWMPQTEWLSNLKLRSSYGTSGSNNIGNFASMALYSSGANYGGQPGITPVQLGNANLQWEKNTGFNVGLEAVLFTKLSAEVEYYHRKSDGLLYSLPLSAGTGFGSIVTNLAAMENRGIEATINYDIVQSRNFNSSVSFNISTNYNKILELNTDRLVSGTKLLEPNASIYQFYMREWAGVNPDNGRPMWFVNEQEDDIEGSNLPVGAYEDPLGSGRQVTSDYAEAERTRLGTSLPDFFGGMNYSLAYKNFELGLYFYYSVGGKVYNVDYATNMHDGTQPGNNLAKEALNAWTPDNRFTDVPRYVVNNTDRGNEMSSRYLEDASYLRLKNISLAYNLPSTLCQRIGIQGLRTFISAENLWTITGYKGFDPEPAINGTTNSQIPGVKSVTMGVKLDI
ncbi:SusC/RagA family TonB-linked outer membrane protein [Sediminitomix flava]|uniref:TonB-linked SusC/RagA family outer membrane protein n=1 Tax=Sediminitomix flava TaxID=379075 RepID=A0A315Z534_SEDFL|nr:TonB-dependent receptor [Sediminitomix flava]PWJ38578.1 TonB-linked SusC/RagA family outer membrane protein [Sediminitomix flava]